MAIDCTPQVLAENAACYCFDKRTADAVKIYLLAVIAGKDSLTPSQLAEAAACYCFDQQTTNRVLAYLACQAASAVGA